MKTPTPIPPLTDELLARLADPLARDAAGIAYCDEDDLTAVLHHLVAYRDAVERCNPEEMAVRFTWPGLINLSAVHARAKCSK